MDVPLMKQMSGLTSDQNFMQKFYLISSGAFEIYRAITSSLLIVFVTQSCGEGDECSLTENVSVDDDGYSADMYTVGLSINFATLFVFIFMYILEFRREHYLIEYLEENINRKNDKETIDAAMRNIAPAKLHHIRSIEKWYKRIGACAISMYIINIIVSAVIIVPYSTGLYTAISFFTFVLFIAKKFVAVYFVISAEENVFLSAHITKTLQYNDIDPKHRLDAPRPYDVNRLD